MTAQTVIIDVTAEFASVARKGEAADLLAIAKDNALEMGMLCPKRDTCATFYMVGDTACTDSVVAQLRAVSGVVAVTPLPARR